MALSREIEYVKSYLVLQKFRYEERLQYDFRISVPKEELFIPKFILQPIVENALKHGIDTLEEGDEVQIEAFADTDDLVIRVINDGTDIDLEQMEKLLFFDPDHMEYLAFSKNGYGVQNIHRAYPDPVRDPFRTYIPNKRRQDHLSDPAACKNYRYPKEKFPPKGTNFFSCRQTAWYLSAF